MNNESERPSLITLKEFTTEFWDQLTNLESKVFRSLRHLVSRPGLLTNSYLSGDRESYVRPLRLFIVVNVIFFFLGPHLQVFKNNTGSYFVGPFGGYAKSTVKRQLSKTQLSSEIYIERLNTEIRSRAGSLVFVAIPLFAAFLKLGWRQRHYVEHLVFSLHFTTAFLVLILLTGLLMLLHPRAILLMPIVIIPFLFLSLRRTYMSRTWVTILMTLPVIAAFLFSYGVFNLSVFWISIALLELSI